MIVEETRSTYEFMKDEKTVNKTHYINKNSTRTHCTYDQDSTNQFIVICKFRIVVRLAVDELPITTNEQDSRNETGIAYYKSEDEEGARNLKVTKNMMSNL